MPPDLRAALVFMCRQVLHPLARLLIRFGISAGDLKAIVDSVYAHAGSEYLNRRGERVTYSRLAVITGINRSFLPAILAVPQNLFQPRSNTQLHRAARVLNGWHEDLAFQTRSGEPATLQIRGEGRTFQQLAHRYSGGVYYRTLLSELLRVGAVKKLGRDRVRAVRRSPGEGGASADALYAAGETAGDLMSTLEHNLTSRSVEQLPVRTLALQVNASILPLFRVQLIKRADGLLEALDGFLQTHQKDVANRERSNDPQTITVGATVFAVRRDSTLGPLEARATSPGEA
jgi:hypothetical protein